MLLALAGVCAAADVAAPAAAQTGKLPGMISGLLLLALLCYSIYVFAAPLLKDRDRSLVWALAILFAVAIVKLALLPWFDGYKNDISSYESWALQMASRGPRRHLSRRLLPRLSARLPLRAVARGNYRECDRRGRASCSG